MKRRDVLQECVLEQLIPAQEVLSNWCHRCINPECTRSQHGTTKFDDRVLHWEERLFLNPAKLEPSDPRYQEIASKRFLTVVPGTPSAPGEWLDPRVDRPEPKMVQVPVQLTPPAFAPQAALPQEVAPTPTPTPQIPSNPSVVRNTPARPQQMIGEAPQTMPSSVSDPWAQKSVPASPGDQVVKPGVKIKLGGQ